MKHQRILSLLAFATAPILTAGAAMATPFLPELGGATFVAGAAIDHPYFPILDNRTRVYIGETVDEDGDPIVESFELTKMGAGPTILGVLTTARRDRAIVDSLLVEDTFDYYAQDIAGNVWYFGEDVTNYLYDDDDQLIGTNSSSSWRAGVNGALPGFAMPADLTVGFNYFQEFAPADNAVDDATTSASGLAVTIDLGTFTNVIRVLETNQLDPDSREFKYYAPGQGLVFVEEGLDASLANPDLSLQLVSAVPLPATLPLLATGLCGLWTVRRHPLQKRSEI